MPKLGNTKDITNLKRDVLRTGLTIPQLIRTAWGSAASFRASDMRGGANGACIMLAPQKDWAVNNPDELSIVLSKLKTVQSNFNRKASGNKKVSMADIIVLGGAAAVEKAADNAGVTVSIPFTPGRTDATQAQTDVTSFSLLEPKADAFRNDFNTKESYRSPAEMLIDKADQLNLTVPEVTALVGGPHVLDANSNGNNHDVLTDNVGALSNDFFVNLLDMSTVWKKSAQESLYEGFNCKSRQKQYPATAVDIVFGSNSELRAIAEVYAYNNAKQKFADDFAKVWHKVMQLERFDLRHNL